MTKRAADQDVRDRLLKELDTSFLVEAAAGTGKTTVLVDRIVAVVQAGRARLGAVMAVTFTEKAAGEMKLRLREALEHARANGTPVERERLTVALEELEVARVGTIHGLCADLLREYPVEAGVDPLFEVASETESDAVLESVFERWFQQVLAKPPEGVRRLLRRRPRSSFDTTPRSSLIDATRVLVEHRDFRAPWRRDPFERDRELDELIPALADLGALTERVTKQPDDSWFLQQLAEVRRFVDDLRHREGNGPRDHDGLEALVRDLNGGPKWAVAPYRVAFDGVTLDQAVSLRDAVHAQLRTFIERSDADLAACLHSELWPIVEGYELEKAQAGRLDYVDLLLRTRELVRGHAAVRRALQARFSHLFVDEFQDTDPLQTELLLLLASSDASIDEPFRTTPIAGKLFAVGDPKQSIYRFRRADIQLYERVKRHLLAHGAQVLHLSASFRSTPAIQRAVNGAFERVLTGGTQAEYVALQPWREPPEGQPSVIALGVPKTFGDKGRVRRDVVERSVPDAVASFIDFLVTRSGWTVEEQGARVAIQPRHICILFTRFRGWGGVDLPRGYTRALEARRVPHVLVGGRSFHAREEVMALRTALAAIDRPDDELSVYATLKGPFFALTDEQLLVFRHEVGKLHPLRPLERDTLSATSALVSGGLELLRELHKERNSRPVADTVHELLERTRAHAGVAFWSAGDQALANVLQLADVTRRIEARATSFREVVEVLHADAEAGEAPEAPIVEEGTQGVRIMTVHGAKGLEFPVVILAEPTANVARKMPSHYVDAEANLWAQPLAGCVPAELREHQAEVLLRDREEAMRVAYVAATRACDLLVVPAIADQQLPDTWTSVLFPALYPEPARAHAPDLAPGCPKFTTDTVTDRQGLVPTGVPMPGLHLAQTGHHRVVWFDANVLELEKEEAGGLQRHEALDATDPEAAAQSVESWRAWATARADTLARGATPSLAVVSARELEQPLASGSVRVEDTGVDRSGRPGGRRFGALVHAVLARVPFDADERVVRALVRLEARARGCPESERVAAVTAVVAALKHDALARARAAAPSAVRREVNVTDVLPDGRVFEGVIDLAFEEAGGWRVVEFKTDEELGAHQPAYEAQAEAYATAIARATGKPATAVLLRV